LQNRVAQAFLPVPHRQECLCHPILQQAVKRRGPPDTISRGTAVKDSTACLDTASLQQLLLGEVPDAQAEAMEQHLLSCPKCIERMRLFKDESNLLTDIRQGAALASEVSSDGPGIEALVCRLRTLTESPTFNTDTTSITVAQAVSGAARDPDRTEAEDFRDCLLPAQEAGEIGRLGPYRVLKVLGVGGMGVVFQAEDPQLQRFIALKVMRSRLASNASSRERFLREARAAAKIEHDHIVAVYHVGEDHGIPYLAMPLLQGETLEGRLERENVLPITEVLRIGREAAAGLAAAHARGMVHRDIKPSNIWLEAGSGRVKILDFGLTRLAQDNVQLTQAGYILGTPSYMAPEQVKHSGSVDGRCDLYSLGVVLYRMTTGRLPFVQNDLMALLSAVASEMPMSPRSLNPAVPPELDALIVRLLAKKPADRPASAEDVVQSLRSIEGGGPLVSKPVRRGYRALAIVAVLVLLLGAAAPFAGPAIYRIVTNKGELVITSDDPDVRVVIKQGGEQVEIVDLKTNNKVLLRSGQYEIELAGNPEKLRLATDKFTLTRNGQQIVSVVREEQRAAPVAPVKNNPVVEQPASSVAPVKTNPVLVLDSGGHTADITDLMFTPDGKRLISSSVDSTVRIWDVATGKTVQVLRLPVSVFDRAGPGQGGHAAALSTDGRMLAMTGWTPRREHPIYLYDLTENKVRSVLLGHPAEIVDVAFSRDGKWLASGGGGKQLNVWEVATGTLKYKLSGYGGRVQAVAFSPDGKVLASGEFGGTLQLWSMEGGKQIGEPRKTSGGITSIAWSPDGTFLAVCGVQLVVQLFNADGSPRGTLDRKSPGQGLAFSRDGKTLLAGTSLLDVDKKEELRRFVMPYCYYHPESTALSPDGKLAASGSDGSGLFLWRTDNRRIVHRLGGRNRALVEVSWSRDGQTLGWKQAPQLGEEAPEFAFCWPDLKLVRLAASERQLAEETRGGLSLKKVEGQAHRVEVKNGEKTVREIRTPQGIGGINRFTFVGDKYAAIGQYSGLFLYEVATGKRVRICQGSGAVHSVAPAPGKDYFAACGIDEVLRVYTIDRDLPLVSLFVVGDEWIAWTPEGYYATSPGGEKFMGWQVPGADGQLPLFYPAAQFHQSLYRPDIIRRLLETHSVAQGP
jgi:WD40 repeat protein